MSIAWRYNSFRSHTSERTPRYNVRQRPSTKITEGTQTGLAQKSPFKQKSDLVRNISILRTMIIYLKWVLFATWINLYTAHVQISDNPHQRQSKRKWSQTTINTQKIVKFFSSLDILLYYTIQYKVGDRWWNFGTSVIGPHIQSSIN